MVTMFVFCFHILAFNIIYNFRVRFNCIKLKLLYHAAGFGFKCRSVHVYRIYPHIIQFRLNLGYIQNVSLLIHVPESGQSSVFGMSFLSRTSIRVRCRTQSGRIVNNTELIRQMMNWKTILLLFNHVKRRENTRT